MPCGTPFSGKPDLSSPATPKTVSVPVELLERCRQAARHTSSWYLSIGCPSSAKEFDHLTDEIDGLLAR